jgi:hypothetical protein
MTLAYPSAWLPQRVEAVEDAALRPARLAQDLDRLFARRPSSGAQAQAMRNMSHPRCSMTCAALVTEILPLRTSFTISG